MKTGERGWGDQMSFRPCPSPRPCCGGADLWRASRSGPGARTRRAENRAAEQSAVASCRCGVLSPDPGRTALIARISGQETKPGPSAGVFSFLK